MRRAVNPAWVAFTWFGATAAISVMATPLHFKAETVTRAIALDVSRVVFIGLNKLELALLVLLLLLVRAAGDARRHWGFVAALALVVLAQSAWMLPELSARTDLVVSGIEPPRSMLHAVYSSSELLKLALLLAFGFRCLPAGGMPR
ncbi:MAG: DUF4149 domain-containing protein [Gammaproteobacteria bacterium]|nr:DUF4149 domain-containing protein [Gammaproteobacteria bacterium]MDH5310264.1 DUF4149 domain-containing protein [Gammaproteobacteria bacterium]